MQQTFKILPEDIISLQTNLFAEISNDGASFFFQRSDDRTITGLSVFNFEKNGLANALQKITEGHNLFRENFSRVFICYAFSESLLTPAAHYNANQNDQNLDLLFGDLRKGILFTDYIEQQSVYNTYRIPAEIHTPIANQFPQATFTHKYSLILKDMQDPANFLKVIFYQNRIIIVLKKEEKLQIIQTFDYITAEDVVYHMLNVCHQFDANEVHVELSGMIEKDSILYNEIQKYFLIISFAELPKKLSYSDEIKEFPSHFFSHLFSFASCV